MTWDQKIALAEEILTAQYKDDLQEVQDMREAELDAWLRGNGVDPNEDEDEDEETKEGQ